MIGLGEGVASILVFLHVRRSREAVGDLLLACIIRWHGGIPPLVGGLGYWHFFWSLTHWIWMVSSDRARSRWYSKLG